MGVDQRLEQPNDGPARQLDLVDEVCEAQTLPMRGEQVDHGDALYESLRRTRGVTDRY
ncbi:MAG: hypothetical protein ACRDZ6_10340 [Acidimicrobiales bacterium]